MNKIPKQSKDFLNNIKNYGNHIVHEPTGITGFSLEDCRRKETANKYWRQGITLITSNTRRWSKEQIDENNKIETRMVFENFNNENAGVNRKLVCICGTSEQAELVCKKYNDLINKVYELNGII